jgi:phospholipid/cholesterol/gamma-HCH transport system permease protein
MSLLDRIGRRAIHGLTDVGELSLQFWTGLRATPSVLPVVGKRGHWQAAIQQMSMIGVNALPMVAVVTGCAGFIFAMQSGAELRRFGATRFVIDIVAIGFTRELGPLLTAIVVSGRSGSAFSAEIGTMVVTSEIAALRTMAIDPVQMVLAPKYVAAMIMVPCLTIMSSVFGIMAGGVFMYLSTGMTFPIYWQYVGDTILLRDVFAGLVKSVAFATIIVHVGCLEGFNVRGGPDAVGRSTTSAVVKSTFLVILADLFFTAVFYITRGL